MSSGAKFSIWWTKLQRYFERVCRCRKSSSVTHLMIDLLGEKSEMGNLSGLNRKCEGTAAAALNRDNRQQPQDGVASSSIPTGMSFNILCLLTNSTSDSV